ncbi:uncharacterized protein BDCG_09249 [Blastomyces dermatitidis ER-3]|uniref:Uncharacterized protein n=1 Tax=Ajellomyces dermatitidis (strain ER-3 / ATCC MYA-2586) TaxID=559297 RepID=A0ABP2ETI2_AJEDR|nr:uncharacterized protein BDCG_09249 [Blastomyces dermatitidis ER-3]EEQ85980.2 hypothetical protein BDCG_09249 [Blastomyces dermatitidis ER-3]
MKVISGPLVGLSRLQSSTLAGALERFWHIIGTSRQNLQGSKGQQPGNAAIMIANGAAPTGSPGYGPLEIPLFDLCASSDAFRKRISRLRAVSVMERLESHLDSVWARLIERAGRLRDTTSRWRTYCMPEILRCPTLAVFNNYIFEAEVGRDSGDFLIWTLGVVFFANIQPFRNNVSGLCRPTAE